MRKPIGSAVMAAALLFFTAGAWDAGAQTPDEGWWTWALPQVAEAARNGGVRGIPEGVRDRDRGPRGEAGEDARDRAEEARERAEERREEARERAEERREREEERWEDERDDERWDDRGRDARDRRGPPHAGRDGRGAAERRGGGPPFCRNGEGHPVHGWRWCVEKGWAGRGYGDRYDPRYDPRYDRRDPRWMPATWEDIVFGRTAPRRMDERLSEPTLGEILGSVILGRLEGHRSRIGASGDLEGRWVLREGARILQVRAGESPLAELTDLDADGRADAVLLFRGR